MQGPLIANVSRCYPDRTVGRENVSAVAGKLTVDLRDVCRPSIREARSSGQKARLLTRPNESLTGGFTSRLK